MNIQAATEALAAANAKTRNLDADDLAHAKRIHDRFQQIFEGKSVLVDLHGGAVARSYKYGAKATWIAYGANEGFAVKRDHALKASHGCGWNIRVTVDADEKIAVDGYSVRREGGKVVYRG